MPALLLAMDAFVLPSRGEGWGRPHVEAMVRSSVCACVCPLARSLFSLSLSLSLSLSVCVCVCVCVCVVCLGSDSDFVSLGNGSASHCDKLEWTHGICKRLAFSLARERETPLLCVCVLCARARRTVAALECGFCTAPTNAAAVNLSLLCP